MLAGALVGGLTHTRAEFMGARVLLGIGTAFAREWSIRSSVSILKRDTDTRRRNHCMLVDPRIGSPADSTHGWRFPQHNLFCKSPGRNDQRI